MQAKPAPFGDLNGRGTTLSSAEDELRRACIEKDKILADQANQIAQNKINSEKYKKKRTDQYNQRVQKRAAAAEAQGQGPKKRPSPPRALQAQPVQAAGPAKGYLLRTSSMSDDKPDSEEEIDTEIAMQAFLSRSLSRASHQSPN